MKKLQVFVSSTYEDLIVERQAAVNAILSAGHIPAGMELFTAGDESQMNVIKRWIEESDVFLLILAGRYGSIEPETGKSYIQLEYEHALSLKKPHFAIVMKDEALDKKVFHKGKSVLELNKPDKLEEFKSLVKSKMVEFFEDTKDIHIAIKNTLSDFEKKEEIVGWIRADGKEFLDSKHLKKELESLKTENSELRNLLHKNVSNENIDSGKQKKIFNRLLNNKMILLLSMFCFCLFSLGVFYNSFYKKVVVQIEGKVLHNSSNNPVKGVKIGIENTTKIDLSDSNGKFYFELYGFRMKDLRKGNVVTLQTYHKSFESLIEEVKLNAQNIKKELSLNPI